MEFLPVDRRLFSNVENNHHFKTYFALPIKITWNFKQGTNAGKACWFMEKFQIKLILILPA